LPGSVEQPRSRLWVYTVRDDILHTSLDPGVQERYRRCVAGPSLLRAVACTLRYLLNEADYPVPVEKPRNVYLYACVYVGVEEGRRVLGLVADNCSLLAVVAIADARGLTYPEAQRILAAYKDEVIPLGSLCPHYAIDYRRLEQALSQGAGVPDVEAPPTSMRVNLAAALQGTSILRRAIEVEELYGVCGRAGDHA